MKSITINYDVVLIILSSIIILVAARDIVVRKNETWYKRISLAGWVLIIAAIGSGCITWEKIQSDNSEKENNEKRAVKAHEQDKKEILKDVDSAFAKHKSSFNPTTKTIITSDTIRILDTSKAQINPVMDLLVMSDNPKLIGNSFDSLQMQFTIGVINGGIAYDIRDRITFFSIVNNSFHFIVSTHRTIPESQKGYKEIANQLKIPLSINRDINHPDTNYFYLKVLYSNKSTNGQDQTPIKKLFLLNGPAFVGSIKDLRFKEVDNNDRFQYLKTKLMESGYW